MKLLRPEATSKSHENTTRRVGGSHSPHARHPYSPENYNNTIAKKGLKSIVAPAPKDGYYRVLVGPLEDPSEIAKTRSELESAGFKNPILQKY